MGIGVPDADFIAELTDVAPGPAGGWTSTQITRGYLRAGAQFARTGPDRAGSRRRVPLVGDDPGL